MKHFLISLFLLFFCGLFAQVPDFSKANEATQKSADSLINAVTKNNESQMSNERILFFNSDITIDKDSKVTVLEKITVIALGVDIKRGIFRTLPLRRNLNGREQKVKYKVVSVTKNGQEENFRTSTENGFLKIYIGKKDIYLSSGVYDYEIKYTTENQIGFFEKYDEFYWNVNGTFWDFPVDQLTATVHLPEGASIVQNSCYNGEYGSDSQNCSSQKINDNTIQWSTENLSSGEGLTIAVGFKKGILLPPPPPSFLEKFGLLIASILVFLGLIVYYFSTWQKYGIDPQKPVVYPQFNAPQNLSPASLGYLRKEGYKSNYITASLVSLAVKGFIKIEESKSEDGFDRLFGKKLFFIKKLEAPTEDLPQEEFSLMNNLFIDKDVVKFDGDYDSDIESTVKNFKANLQVQHDTFLNKGNNHSKLWLPLIVITLIYGAGLLISNYINPDAIKMVLGFVFYVIAVVICIFVIALVKEFSFSWKFLLVVPAAIFFYIGNGIHFGKEFSGDENFLICYLFLVISATAFIVYSFLIKRPSEEKLETKSLIEGFKMYMGAAENEQLKFHNPPKMTPQIFESLLPYAIVLGVDKIWGEKFASMLKNSAMTYQSSWYIGNSFNATSFGSSLNSNLSNSISSASTAPSSSGSGSGGGGFSGGGGGGGGGGGW